MWKIFGGLYLGWSLGANDSANIFGTGVTTGIISYRKAIILTAFFVVLGAVLQGEECMDTVGGMADITLLEAFFCTFAAAVTMTVLTYFSIPASTSQAIMGSVIGIGFIKTGMSYFQTGDTMKEIIKIVSCWLLTPIGGAAIGFILFFILQKLVFERVKKSRLVSVVIKLGFIISGCYGSYALGANNVANATGVYAGRLFSSQWAALIGGLAIASGAITYSKKVMMTVGKKITLLDPYSAFVSALALALTVHIFTFVKVPVSSSQAIVGVVLGIGLYKGVKSISKKTLIEILIGWIATPTSAALMSIIFYKLFC